MGTPAAMAFLSSMWAHSYHLNKQQTFPSEGNTQGLSQCVVLSRIVGQTEWRSWVTNSLWMPLQGWESPGLETMECTGQEAEPAPLLLSKHTELLPQYLGYPECNRGLHGLWQESSDSLPRDMDYIHLTTCRVLAGTLQDIQGKKYKLKDTYHLHVQLSSGPTMESSI